MEVPDYVRRSAVQMRAHRLLLQEIISYLQTTNSALRGEIYESICHWFDETADPDNSEGAALDSEVRRYIGEVLSVVDPNAPMPI